MALLTLGRSDRADILAGVFVLLGVALAGTWFLVKVVGQSLQRNEYLSFPADVTGLRIGTPVMVAGYRVGLVTRIEPMKAGMHAAVGSSGGCIVTPPERTVAPTGPRFELALAIENDWRITTESRARLDNPSLLGQPIVSITLGSGTSLCPGSSIPFDSGGATQPAPDLAGLAQRAERVLGSVDEFVKQLSSQALPERAGRFTDEALQAADRITAAAEVLDQFFRDPELRAAKSDIRRATAQMADVLADVRRLTRDVRDFMPSLSGVVAEVRPPLREAAVNLNHTLRLTGTRVPAILADLERSAQELSALLADLRANPGAALRGRPSELPAWRESGR